MVKAVTASDFASAKDLEEYLKAKAEGLSDRQAYAVGDSGIGCWGDLRWEFIPIPRLKTLKVRSRNTKW